MAELAVVVAAAAVVAVAAAGQPTQSAGMCPSGNSGLCLRSSQHQTPGHPLAVLETLLLPLAFAVVRALALALALKGLAEAVPALSLLRGVPGPEKTAYW